MRIFDHPNMHGDWVCPVCKTKADKPVVLVGKDGTEMDNIMEVVQTHVDCLDLTMRQLGGVAPIYQLVEV